MYFFMVKKNSKNIIKPSQTTVQMNIFEIFATPN